MEGLIDGDYTLAESTAPIGFVLTMEPHPFTIQAPEASAARTVRVATARTDFERAW